MSAEQSIRRKNRLRCQFVALVLLASGAVGFATPANKAALNKHYDRFLSKSLDRCTTCHRPSEVKVPQNLEEFPHNNFGHRLRILGDEQKDIPTRLTLIAQEDSDGDGVPNETELLLGHNPGDAKDSPVETELADASKRANEFKKFLVSYRWQPFDPVRRPPVPKVKNSKWVRNPVDAFIAAEHEARKLKPRPEASKQVLLRRVYLDLIGLTPTPEEQRAFENDNSRNAYEKVVDRLLADPRYGERWGRHWMDIWRYSDWAGWSGGNQIRDSKPHIWRWRDWIIESLNTDKPYDRMLIEMLAADELFPGDTNALPATGFLVRNYKMLSREQWLEDTIKHTSQAFLGITMGCAKCHDHMLDPISQREYYQMRAIFEPHNVRTDRVPGEVDVGKNGLVFAYDKDTNAVTYFFVRGDERKPDTNQVMVADVPKALGGRLGIAPVKLPWLSAFPDKREFVIRDVAAASERSISEAREKLEKLRAEKDAKSEKIKEAELSSALAESKHASLLAVLEAERLEDRAQKETEEWKQAAEEAVTVQRKMAVIEAELKLHQAQTAQAGAQAKLDEATLAAAKDEKNEGDADKKSDDDSKKKKSEKAQKDLEAARKKTEEAEKALAEAKKTKESSLNTSYKARPADTHPEVSTGRRTAFARWVANPQNPLTARVAMNHIWLRHFGRGIVPTSADFGRNGKPASHPQLLDWLAAEFMMPTGAASRESAVARRRGYAGALTRGRSSEWSMKHIHRFIVTSTTYRMASTPDDADAQIDPDNVYLWRTPSRRMEAELVRDNLLYVAGDLDQTSGGPDIDHNLGLTSKRRSLYLRFAAEKEVEFLKIFDGPSVTECYERRSSVVPQQALALANSELALRQARSLAQKLASEGAEDTGYIAKAFSRILARKPSAEELRLCLEFLRCPEPANDNRAQQASSGPGDERSSHQRQTRARENLILVLLNHNDFVTVR